MMWSGLGVCSLRGFLRSAGQGSGSVGSMPGMRPVLKFATASAKADIDGEAAPTPPFTRNASNCGGHANGKEQDDDKRAVRQA
ncbi:hypothetical protein OKW46_003412 [Paraburkholderia sp. WSM4179]|nr:hypothetical protein [Paraburkholderia sp. WSM4179]